MDITSGFKVGHMYNLSFLGPFFCVRLSTNVAEGILFKTLCWRLGRLGLRLEGRRRLQQRRNPWAPSGFARNPGVMTVVRNCLLQGKSRS